MSRHAETEEFDVDDPRLNRFDLVREGARRDGVRIVHYEPRFPVPGTTREKRVERSIAMLFLLGGLAATAFVVGYIWWPFHYEAGANINKLYTPVLGVTLGLTLLTFGMAIILWGKKLLPEEIAVQERHGGASPRDEQRLTGATMMNMADELGIRRRPLLRRAALLGLLPAGVVAAAPLIGGFIQDPNRGHILAKTAWRKGIQLVRDDMTPIRPEEISVGGQMTVFPGIPGGNTNKYGDSPTLLIHLRDEDAATLRRQLNKDNANNQGSMWRNFVAYSKICTHAGCPASLFEQQSNILLCPCHQSQFNITDNARPVFGPATRPLPMLPISVDGNGFFVAQSDYKQPVGPGFWERPDETTQD